jgi:hypothetical protein
MGRKCLAAFVLTGATLLASAQPAGSDGPFQYFSLTPCRAVDTRNTSQSVGGYGPGLTSGQMKPFKIQGNCLVPVGAAAVTINVTVVKPSTQTILSQGNLGLFPTGVTPPTVSTINFPKGTIALANGAIVPLADQSVFPQDLTVKAFLLTGGKVDVVLDVTGYFE